ncbi:hypothetical protein diail_4773 [Diaporthe ilicicola]|nr:hypothetical protein diail_4773 [Diaporthe ilicicola]
MSSIEGLPKPTFVTGGCLCGAIRYRIDFPQGHNFAENTGTCQCTQCRRNSGSLFFSWVQIPKSCLKWLGVKEEKTSTNQDGDWLPFDRPPSALRSFSATPGIGRTFCSTCGGFISWMKDGGLVDVTVGTIDPLFLLGPGDDPEVEKSDVDHSAVDRQNVPKGGYGSILAGGYGRNYWCSNEIRGVTDELVTVGAGRGKRYLEED